MDLVNVATQQHQWRLTCVPDETIRGALSHLAEESREMCEAPCLEEAADVLLCLLSWVDLAGYNAIDLLHAAQVKVKINGSRTWSIDQAGYYRHE